MVLLGGCTRQPTTSEGWLEWARSKSDIQREQAAYHMTTNYAVAYRVALTLLVMDDDITVRYATMRNIHKTKDLELLPALQEVMRNASLDDRKMAMEAIAKLKAEVAKDPSSEPSASQRRT
jgi:hypothetical protein